MHSSQMTACAGWSSEASEALLLTRHSQGASRAVQHLLRRHGAGARGDPLQGADIDLLHVHVLLATPAAARRLRHVKPQLVQSTDLLMPSKRACRSQ